VALKNVGYKRYVEPPHFDTVFSLSSSGHIVTRLTWLLA